MNEDYGHQRAGSEEQKGRVGAKHGRVRELDNGTRHGCDKRDVRATETKLVKVMNVSTAKDKRRQKDDALGTRLGQYKKRHDGRAKEALFGDGALWEDKS